MKTTLKQLTTGTFITLLFLAGNAKASEIKTTRFEAKETTLQLESWMTDETIWNNNTVKIMDFSQETEANLPLENWMINTDLWDINNSILEDAEAELQLEDWMINDETWNTKNVTIEPELTVEPWMINNNIWEQD